VVYCCSKYKYNETLRHFRFFTTGNSCALVRIKCQDNIMHEIEFASNEQVALFLEDVNFFLRN
jgi:hypothetical protein